MKDKNSTMLTKNRVNYIPSLSGVSLLCIGFIKLLRRDIHSENPYIRTSAARFFKKNTDEAPMFLIITTLLELLPAEIKKAIKKKLIKRI